MSREAFVCAQMYLCNIDSQSEELETTENGSPRARNGGNVHDQPKKAFFDAMFWVPSFGIYGNNFTFE